MNWTWLHPDMTLEHLGFIPYFLNDNDPDDAVKQIDKNYGHGGGWRDYNGFTMDDDGTLNGKGDPPLHPLATTSLRDETIYFYRHSWVAVRQPDKSFRVARID